MRMVMALVTPIPRLDDARASPPWVINDGSDAIHPDADEVCDERDNDWMVSSMRSTTAPWAS